MRYWIFAALVLILSIGFRDIGQPQRHYSSLSHKIRHPFDSRVHYRLGTIDPRFGISEAEAIKLAAEAAQIWQQGIGKVLFVYDPTASLSINLRFDERQDNANRQRIEQQQLQQQLSDQNNTSHEYHQRKMQLAQQRLQLDAHDADFQQQLDHYNRRMASWNTLGNLDDFNREQLRQKRKQLDLTQQQIRQAMDDYNQQVIELNEFANHFNQSANQYNQKVEQLNRQFTPREFEKGNFDGDQITIYEFSTPADLRLTMAHELGHALGLKHNNDPYALMYPLLKQQDAQNFKLRAADLALYHQ